MFKNKTVFVAFLLILMTGFVYATPGEFIKSRTSSPMIASVMSASSGLQPTITENGKISWSVDAIGENTGSGVVSVQKPAGATVRGAYLMAASAGFSGYQITSSDITLAGSPVNFTTEIANGISSYNYFTDVTSIVKPIINNASAGITNLTVTEANTNYIDGETLVVIFNDPNQVNDNTIILAFGAQKTTGDSFNIGLSEAINKAKLGFMLDMSLGISFGFQPDDQYSQVDVNGQRLTTSAGGQDDGAPQDGALITTGGIGDNNSNPADPYATDSNGPRYDDELYNLVPFVNDGDKAITVDTLNPSNDDNIFFAGFFLGSTTALVGEGVLLSPESATDYIGDTHTLTAKAQYNNGSAIVGTNVTFLVTSGPNAGLSGSAITNVNGTVTWSYIGYAVGTDTIRASFNDVTGKPIYSNEVTKKWIEHSTQRCVSDMTLVTGTVYDKDNKVVPGKDLTVTCTHDGVPTSKDVTTIEDGSYQVVFPKNACQTDDVVVVSTTDDISNSGTVTNNCNCVVNLAIIDLTIPEFGVIAGGLALVGALGIFLYRRK